MKIMMIACLGTFLWVFLWTLLSSSAFASVRSSDDHIRHQKSVSSSQFSVLSSRSPALTAGVFQQDIDHFGLLPLQTFAQRYWIDSQYASSNADAPVIYHICGEGDAETGYFLQDNAIEWAKALGAHLVYLEHRYYGKSLPFDDLSTEHMQYLTLDNTIEDLAHFQNWIAQTQGLKGKWISVGGSYSGTLSAIYRLRHPELVAGALASSAPMISGVGQYEGTASDVNDLSSTDASSDGSDRQWVYQSCTTFGFWQADGPNIGANLINPSQWLCQQLFGNAPYANSTVYNQNYDAPYIANVVSAPTNILFTYGSVDVWTTIGLAQQKNLNPNISILVINGAGHHFDLNDPDPSDTPDVLAARATFLDLAKKWLN